MDPRHVRHHQHQTLVPGKDQWRLFRLLEAMVENGRIGFPRQVRAEVDDLAHPDTPGTWVLGVFDAIQYPTEPDSQWLREVMGCEAAKVVDPNKTKDDADPYVLAMALHLQELGYEVVVVTDDHVDQPARIAVTSACDILQLAWVRMADFLLTIDY